MSRGGGRPRRPWLSGVRSVTPSELRVARMSNGEIAQALFIITQTVTSHLSGAYRKLGIASRSQLAAMLSEDARRIGLAGRAAGALAGAATRNTLEICRLRSVWP